LPCLLSSVNCTNCARIHTAWWSAYVSFKHARIALLCLSLQSSLRLWCNVKKLRELKMEFRSKSVILPVYSPTSCKSYPIREKHKFAYLIVLQPWTRSPPPRNNCFAGVVGVSCLEGFCFYYNIFDAILTMTHFVGAWQTNLLCWTVYFTQTKQPPVVMTHNTLVPPPQVTLLIWGVWADNVMEIGVVSSYALKPGYNTSLTYCHAERRDWVLQRNPISCSGGFGSYVGPQHNYRVWGFSWFLSVSKVNSLMSILIGHDRSFRIPSNISSSNCLTIGRYIIVLEGIMKETTTKLKYPFFSGKPQQRKGI